MRPLRFPFAACLVVLALAGAACTGQGLADIDPSAGDNPSSSPDGGVGLPPGGTSGLPCDVQDFVSQSCAQCHGAVPSGGAPVSLTSRADFLASSPSGSSYGQRAVVRVKDAANPMPPGGMLTASSIAILEAWVQAGMPAGSCGGIADPFSVAPICTSNSRWTRGDDGKPTMHPGMACISCHVAEDEGPDLTVAGTLFPTAHEPDDCNGATSSSGLKIVITDANGRSFTLTPNSAGNFYSQIPIATPYRAKVVDSSGKERTMSAAQSDGDCNGCHTQSGDNGAPGRIIGP